MLDAHYTPPEIARKMLLELPLDFSPNTVADFACGDGALLLEAANRWPSSQLIANDIDTKLIKRLQRKHGNWITSTADFVSETSLKRSKIYPLQRSVDCILINPPFSEKGKARLTSSFFGSEVTTGSTMAFLLRALQFLAPNGYMVAILPDSCFISDRDKLAWSNIKSHFSVRKVLSNSRSTFKGIAASTTVAVLRYRQHNDFPLAKEKSEVATDIEIVRGKLQMHTVEKWRSENGFPLVHTSNLVKNKIDLKEICIVNYKHVIRGPAVLIPRVGLVTRDKIAILPRHKSVVMSDCVLAVKCETNNHAKVLTDVLFAHWDVFRTAYGGTGAPYTTLERINEVVSYCINANLDSQNHRKAA
ncbi:methyltransferase [Duganella sp. CY15W]|uniref:N-6 DNA methylase n=1 Tax=Duganella sp. CY15W TaxID=2692172 RepID=UPI00136A961C|nr:methyltransferase [Duganella sp. CY15W]MYM29031.1 methyltransferase [Duganella sp. CY15W]